MAIIKTVFLFYVFLFFNTIYAQWHINGIPVVDMAGMQRIGANGLLSDGEGGAFIIWGDDRDGWDIYAQRVDSNGTFYWAKNGKAIAKAVGMQFAPRFLDDGNGGFVTIWADTRNDGLRDIYAQRVDKNGNSLWESNGVPIIIEERDQIPTSFIKTSDDCYIVCWNENKFGYDARIYAQKFDNNGKILWDSTGTEVSSLSGLPVMVSDFEGGAILSWASMDGSNHLYAQRIDGYGKKIWNTDYIIAANDYCRYVWSDLSICCDSLGGAFIAWDFMLSADYGDSYIQHIDKMGTRLWGDFGIQILGTHPRQYDPIIKLYNQDTLLCIWMDNNKILLNKYDFSGNSVGSVFGNTLSNLNSRLGRQIAIDHLKNIFISNFNLTTIIPNRHKPLVHKTDSDFYLYWDSSGTKLSEFEIESVVGTYPGIIPDEKGGAIIAWEDDRKDYPHSDIFIQRVYSDGSVGGDTSTSIYHSEDGYNLGFDVKTYPNPFNQSICFRFLMSTPASATVDIYSVLGQKINSKSYIYSSGGSKEILWNGKNSSDEDVSSGIYIYRFQTHSLDNKTKYFQNTGRMILIR